jgi:hypothetical protein
VGHIADERLTGIEKEINGILKAGRLKLINQEFASRQLPKEIADSLRGENHNKGDQYLHGLFQKTD